MDMEGVISPHDFSGYSRTTIRQLAPCPLCMAPDAATETSSETLHIAGMGSPIRVGYGYCATCGHIYQVSPPSQSVLTEYYSKFSNYTNTKPPEEPSAMTRRLLGIVRDHAAGPGYAYEVGCATGVHLVHFRKAGWEVRGCDPSPKACALASELYGLDLDCGLEAETLPKVQGLDLIYFSGVLEHLPDPVGALRRTCKSLKPSGMVMLEVPCATSPESLPPGWFAFEHLHYFTPHAVKQMLGAAGFDLIEARVSYRDFIYPVITAIAKKAVGYTSVADGDGWVSAEFIKTYNARDKMLWARAAQKLSEIKGPYYIWGGGIHTAQLFDHIPGCAASVKAIMDRDPQKWGHLLAGKKIFNAAAYASEDDSLPVVISSYANEAEIAADLAKRGTPENRIVRLYT